MNEHVVQSFRGISGVMCLVYHQVQQEISSELASAAEIQLQPEYFCTVR